MLLNLTQWLMRLYPELGFLRVFQYLTFRSVMAAMTALIIGLFAGPWVIRRLRELKIGQPVRGYAMETHLSKSGTPTMGGVLILLAITLSTLLWFDLSNRFVWTVLTVTLGFGAIGWSDDWRKVVRKDPDGAVFQADQLPTGCMGLCGIDLCGDCGQQQCRQFDRRTRWFGDHAGCDGGLRAWAFCLCHGQQSLF